MNVGAPFLIETKGGQRWPRRGHGEEGEAAKHGRDGNKKGKRPYTAATGTKRDNGMRRGRDAKKMQADLRRRACIRNKNFKILSDKCIFL